MQAAALGGRRARNTVTAPIVLYINYCEQVWWVLCAETVAPLDHPDHITLCHGKMVMPAITIVFTHSFEVVAEAKVVAVICFRDAYSDIGCCVNGAADAEPWGHLKVGGRPMVVHLGGFLRLPTVPSWWGCGRTGRGGDGVIPCLRSSGGGFLGSEGPWQGDVLQPEVPCGEFLLELFEVRPTHLMSPHTAYTAAFYGLPGVTARLFLGIK